MYYASFGILAVILHIIINFDVIKNGRIAESNRTVLRYRQFLCSMLIFYIADLSWGFLVDLKIRNLVYADTVLFFATMALSVLLWTRYVVAFVDKKGLRAKSFMAAGWGIFGFVILALIVNFFIPVIFLFTDDVLYVPCFGRYILMAVQFLLFVLISVYSLFVSQKSNGRERIHYMAVSASGGVMAILIVLQTQAPFAPFYTIGTLIANCMVHVFVVVDDKKEQDRITADARKEKERYSQIAASLAMDYDVIYYIDIETGEYLNISSGTECKALNIMQKGKDFYEEAREKVLKDVYPDDRAFAESMYYKETMLKNLEGHRSYSYKYRIMTDNDTRFFQFNVLLSDDGKHFVLCGKDIQDTITAETAFREKQKANITFARIAESLASNYDVIYYVNLKNGEYVGYTSKNIYGELEIDEAGDDFFADSIKNAELLVHPEDRESLLARLDRDYMISTLGRRKQLDTQYRIIINNLVQHMRLSARKTSDEIHVIIGVENIDEEVRKEKEYLHALNTEKEQARRDEMTGVKNKKAFSELGEFIQDGIERGTYDKPFALAVCDLNNLKKINDTKGHKAGDDYIISSARLLCEIFDHSPVFRIGGDEFAVFLTGNDYASRNILIDKLRKHSISNRDSYNGPVIAVGMAEYDYSQDSSIYDLFEIADKMMYEDKQKLKKDGEDYIT